MTSGEYSAGYNFVFNPPEVKSDVEMRKQLSLPDDVASDFIVKRDFYRFIFQIMAIPFLTTGLLLVFSSKRSYEKLVLGSVSLCIGCFFVSLVCLIALRG